jgi:hypothetical protein
MLTVCPAIRAKTCSAGIPVLLIQSRGIVSTVWIVTGPSKPDSGKGVSLEKCADELQLNRSAAGSAASPVPVSPMARPTGSSPVN